MVLIITFLNLWDGIGLVFFVLEDPFKSQAEEWRLYRCPMSYTVSLFISLGCYHYAAQLSAQSWSHPPASSIFLLLAPVPSFLPPLASYHHWTPVKHSCFHLGKGSTKQKMANYPLLVGRCLSPPPYPPWHN